MGQLRTCGAHAQTPGQHPALSWHQADTTLQHSSVFGSKQMQSLLHNEHKIMGGCRRRYHVALLMFPPQKRWHVYCQAGPDVAIKVLNKFIAKLPSVTSVSPAGNSLPLQLAASDPLATSQPALDPVAIAEHRQLVSGVIGAFWDQFHETHFKLGTFDTQFKIDGYGTFADAAQAFDQPNIALQIRKCKLRVRADVLDCYMIQR